MPDAMIQLEWGAETLSLRLPARSDLLPLPPCPPLPDPARAVREALQRPIGAPPLERMIRERTASGGTVRAVIVVSDTTRPVPYRGEADILTPLLDLLRAAGGVQTTILVANGTHHPLSERELRGMLCDAAFAPDVTIINHVAADRADLRCLGHTRRGTEVWINRHYLEADFRILTGLVEPHIMAGVSGGRKSICPGLLGERGTYGFHSAAMIEHPRADSLLLEGNPCHQEALAVARMAGADFILNVTLDRERRLTGVFAGDLVAAHEAAAAQVIALNRIPIRREYDLVLTHAGFVGINHYQAGKAALEAAKAIRPGGAMILAARHTDAHPVGGTNYRALIRLLDEIGPEAFTRRVLSPEWVFIPEQWQVQVWCKALRKLQRRENLVYCSPQLTGTAFREARAPGADAGTGLSPLQGRDLAEAMVQRAVDAYLAAHPDASVAVLPDGPYGTPCLMPTGGNAPASSVA